MNNFSKDIDIFDELDDIIPAAQAKPILQEVKKEATPAVAVAPISASVPTQPAVVDIKAAIAKLKAIENELNMTFYERKDAIQVMIVALVSKMSTFFIGPPGTGR